ncbi:hypothetical protein PLANPX_4910 [Lacipirellula parvula]|uniref:Uncharacterized protein n=1 Tax=Lacipirellula parvula TaxID=2650471 RepID=A0A5K7XFK9_9BACT|nr:hypothetical protein PLANPX_4910 [Lacipirellula parvula]
MRVARNESIPKRIPVKSTAWFAGCAWSVHHEAAKEVTKRRKGSKKKLSNERASNCASG